jgi:membrane fusion protein (multidrug efflux system)
VTNRTKWVAGGLTAAAVAVGVWAGVKGSPSAATEPAVGDTDNGVATVTTVDLRTGDVPQTVTAYGSVTAEPGVVAVLSVAVECRVRHLRVAGGQAVESGNAIIEVEPSPDAKLQLVDARNALEGAKKDAANAHQRFDLKLATNADVQTADQAARSAQAKVDDLEQRGAGEDHRTITAGFAGVVGKVDVQEGQLVPAGGPLVELVPRDRIEVRLGVEPADTALVKPDQAAQLFPTSGGGEAVDGRVRLVTRRVSPDSRLVDVFVAPAQPDAMLLDGFVRGELTVRTAHGLVVPHEALLPDDQGFSLFTVKDGHAVKHGVTVALQNDREAVVTGDGLQDGDPVVVAGNLELDDGAAVAVAAPATTGPTTAGADK